VAGVKVLLVHNFYGSEAPSGENIAFEAERDLLQSQGIDVETFSRHSDEIRAQGLIGTIRGGLSTPWNPIVARQVANRAVQLKADIVHVHNTFPLISHDVFHQIWKTPSAIVHTLHNFRSVCAAGSPFRAGKYCSLCIEKQSVVDAVVFGCYRESRLATVPLAAAILLSRFRRTWSERVDALIAISEEQRRLLMVGGMPASLLHVKPNFVSAPTSCVPDEARTGLVFVGRLTEEKGVMTLIEAHRAWGEQAPPLTLIGDGPLRKQIAGIVDPSRVRVLGVLDSNATRAEIAHARVLVAPSRSVETFGLVVVEAFAHGTPVVASDSYRALVDSGQSGLVFGNGADSSSLLAALKAMWTDPELRQRCAAGGRRRHHDEFGPEANIKLTRNIYESALAHRRARAV
jgi:glycosyltransferase involved in cell wall biosynthesis